ncbi:hypothetical protein LCGC14_2872730, partial [marine sediment metagenome]
MARNARSCRGNWQLSLAFPALRLGLRGGVPLPSIARNPVSVPALNGGRRKAVSKAADAGTPAAKGAAMTEPSQPDTDSSTGTMILGVQCAC